jgi:large subunit ribosomal protein L13e
VCQDNEAAPDATFFFRMAPVLEMQYPKYLLFPLRTGHQPVAVAVVLRGDAHGWQVRSGKGTEVARTEDGFRVNVPPTNDFARFELVKEGQPAIEIPIQVTVPRLRWALSRHITWTDTPLTLDRDSMRYGTQLDLCAQTNMDARRHALSAMLQRGSESLQEAKFILRRGIYRLPLNGFYDTISGEARELVIRLFVRGAADGAKVGETVVLRIPGLEKQPLGESSGQHGKTAAGSDRPSQRAERKPKPPAQPRVPIRHGSRRSRTGRGFSREELGRVGIRLRDTARVHVRVDRRRKSCHDVNVEVLKSRQQKVNHHAD